MSQHEVVKAIVRLPTNIGQVVIRRHQQVFDVSTAEDLDDARGLELDPEIMLELERAVAAGETYRVETPNTAVRYTAQIPLSKPYPNIRLAQDDSHLSRFKNLIGDRFVSTRVDDEESGQIVSIQYGIPPRNIFPVVNPLPAEESAAVEAALEAANCSDDGHLHQICVRAIRLANKDQERGAVPPPP